MVLPLATAFSCWCCSLSFCNRLGEASVKKFGILGKASLRGVSGSPPPLLCIRGESPAMEADEEDGGVCIASKNKEPIKKLKPAKKIYRRITAASKFPQSVHVCETKFDSFRIDFCGAMRQWIWLLAD
jgi:hypothetical protein